MPVRFVKLKTLTDAGQWADKLHHATVASKKNLVIDTTITTARSDLSRYHQLLLQYYLIFAQSLRLLQHLLRICAGFFTDFQAAQHAGQFFDTCFRIQCNDHAMRAAIGD